MDPYRGGVIRLVRVKMMGVTKLRQTSFFFFVCKKNIYIYITGSFITSKLFSQEALEHQR